MPSFLVLAGHFMTGFSCVSFFCVICSNVLQMFTLLPMRQTKEWFYCFFSELLSCCRFPYGSRMYFIYAVALTCRIVIFLLPVEESTSSYFALFTNFFLLLQSSLLFSFLWFFAFEPGFDFLVNIFFYFYKYLLFHIF